MIKLSTTRRGETGTGSEAEIRVSFVFGSKVDFKFEFEFKFSVEVDGIDEFDVLFSGEHALAGGNILSISGGGGGLLFGRKTL